METNFGGCAKKIRKIRENELTETYTELNMLLTTIKVTGHILGSINVIQPSSQERENVSCFIVVSSSKKIRRNKKMAKKYQGDNDLDIGVFLLDLNGGVTFEDISCKNF